MYGVERIPFWQWRRLVHLDDQPRLKQHEGTFCTAGTIHVSKRFVGRALCDIVCGQLCRATRVHSLACVCDIEGVGAVFVGFITACRAANICCPTGRTQEYKVTRPCLADVLVELAADTSKTCAAGVSLTARILH